MDINKVAVIGLGLIGGSICKAIKFHTEYTVLGYDISEITLKRAVLVGAIDGVLCTDEELGECDMVILAAYPAVSMEYLTKNAGNFKKNAVVIDLCGTKRSICSHGYRLAAEHGFNFIGGHPMAGTHNSGFKYSREDMFKNATMVMVAKKDEDIRLLEAVKAEFISFGFGAVTFTSADIHDRVIAYTSQLAHVVSNAYVKSPSSHSHKGMSAGSYKDLTRVAMLNEDMWSELFLDNADNLSNEIDILINELSKYSAAIKNRDLAALKNLLREGREIKEREE